MRNRVARSDVHRSRVLVARVGVLLAVPAVLGLTAAQVAAAQTDMAKAQLSFGLGGLVGIIAVILGVGGLVAGLFRHRRTAAARAAALLARKPAQPEPARTETPV